MKKLDLLYDEQGNRKKKWTKEYYKEYWKFYARKRRKLNTNNYNDKQQAYMKKWLSIPENKERARQSERKSFAKWYSIPENKRIYAERNKRYYDRIIKRKKLKERKKMTIKCPECSSKKITFHHDFDQNYRFITCFTQNSKGKFFPTFNSEDIKDIEKGISAENINCINGNPLYSCNDCTLEFDNNSYYLLV